MIKDLHTNEKEEQQGKNEHQASQPEVKEQKNQVDLSRENKELQAQIKDLKATLERLRNEQEKLILATKVNTLKEQEIRNDEFKKYTNQKIIKEMVVPMLLEFEQALNFKTENKDVKNFLIGFRHIFNKFRSDFKSEGLEPLTAQVGAMYDSSIDEATQKIMITTENPHQKNNMIAEVVLSGYKLHDRLIKPVQVKIYQLETKKTDSEK